MSKKRRSNFGAQTVSDAKKQKEAGKGSSTLRLPKNIRFLAIEEDTKRIKLDFLPYEVTDAKHPDRDDSLDKATPGSLWYKRPYKIHRGIGANNDTAVCLKSVGKKCPICDYVQEKMKKGASWDEVKDIAAKDRCLYIVVPIDVKKHDEVPYVWDVAQFLFQEVLNDTLLEEEENGVFPDLENGKTMEIKMRWKPFGKKKFFETADIKFIDRDAYDESILDDIPNLDDCLILHSYEELQAMFFEMEDVPPADVEDDVEPVRVRRKKEQEEEEEEERPVRRNTRKKEEEDEDEEEEEDEDEEEEEDEDEEKPKKHITRTERPQRRVAKKEEPEEEDEEEEEEKPVRAKKSIKEPVKPKAGDKKDRCPHGYRFGMDTNKYDECDSCDLWDECSDAKDARK
jgi:hypothetical protein